MARAVFLSLAAALIVVLGPVLLHQLRPPEPRMLDGATPDPARSTEIHFRNEAQDIDLAGLLFVPEGEGPFPAAVIIHGSGTSSRTNRWYLTLTHYLQDNGIAVLLPDKRGSEQSGGDWRGASFEDLATDTLAAIEHLRRLDQLPISGIGVIGMSQGGWIATVVADRANGLAFLVSVVGSAVTTHEQLLYEENHNLRQLGVLPGVSNLLAHPATFVLRNFVQKTFWDAVGDFDPLPYWRRLAIPALALYGEQDSNVPTAISAELLRGLDNPSISVVIYAGSGHALQDPRGQGNRLFREDALRAVRDFINATNR